MKKYLMLFIIVGALFSSNMLAQYDVNLLQYKIVNLQNDNSVKVLAGVANIRIKLNKSKTSIFALQNNDFKIISQYLPDSRKISKQTERFNKYSTEQQKRILETEEVLSRTFIVEFNSNVDVLKFCYKLLKDNPNIEVAEPYYVNESCGMPDDPEVVNQSVLQYIKAFEGWNICEGDSTVLIGVGDTGFNIDHKDLKEQIAYNDKEIRFNRIDDDDNGYIDDYRGYNFTWIEDGGEDYYDDVYNQSIKHGLDVAGIVGARVNNGVGIAGVGNKCKIVPIKLVERGSSDKYLYAYQSLLYAAARGCKVLNCSWGVPNHFSIVNQSIVDYVIACDVAIVAAAGNMQSGVTNNHCTFYPAGYYGVLGVGGTNPSDEADLSNYVLGTQTRILAQAEGNLSLGGHITTTTSGKGTSYATPVVSGVVGILRSYRPELSPQEAIELVRVSSDSVVNTGGFVPNRVNMLKTLQADASLTPAIVLREQYFETLDEDYIERVYENGHYYYVIRIKNILGDAKNIKLSLENLIENNIGFDFVDINLDSIGFIPELNHNEEAEIKLKVELAGSNIATKDAYFKLVMSGENKQGTSFKDNFNFWIKINNKLNTISNDKLIVSINDVGVFGFDRQGNNIVNGYGFEHKEYGDFLFEGGLLAISDDSKVSYLDDFEQVEGFATDEYVLRIINDTKNSVKINAEYSFPIDTSSALKLKITARNTNNKPLQDFAIGNFFDWDINNHNYNSVGYFEEAIPDDLDKYTAAAEYATDISGSVYVGSLVFINKNKYTNVYVTPQAASGFFNSNEELIAGLTSGITKQINDQMDIQYIIGLLYSNPIQAGDFVECVICTGISKTKDELANTLKECAKSELTSIVSDNDDTWYEMKMIDGKLEVKLDCDNSVLEIFDLLGKKLLTQEISSGNSTIDISSFFHNVYYVRLNNGKKIIVEKVAY
jgi:hypothetical protein